MFDLSNPKKEEDNQRFRIPPPLFQTLPGPRINSLPKLTPAPAPMKFNMRPAHTMPKVQEQPDYKSAWIRGTLGSLAGRAVTPLVEKLSGRKIDLSTLPESNTFGEKAVGMIGNLGADLPLWLGGDALLAKPLSALAKYAPVAKGVNMLPEAITPALGTGVRAGATYGGPINLAETAMNRDGAEGFTNRLKEAPLMALGGSVLHGGGQLLGKGVKTGIDYKRFNTATKLPEIKSNPLQDLQNAYKNPVSLRNAKQQQLNKTFENTPNLMQSASTKTLQQGIDGATGVQKHLSGELLQQKKLDAQSAFGGPLKTFKINKDLEGSIAEITAKMDKQVNDMAASIKQADGQTKILTIRQQVKDMGGISPSKGDLFEEQQVIPAWIKKANGRPLDEVADELGMTSNELLFAISDSAYKKKDYVTEAYRMAYKDPEYQALSNTLDSLKGDVIPKRSPNMQPSLKPREPKAPKIESPLPQRIIPKREPLQWTNKDNLGQAGPLPIRSINEGNLGQLPGQRLPARQPTPLRPQLEAPQVARSEPIPGDDGTIRPQVDRKPIKRRTFAEILKGARTQFIDDVAPLENLEKNVTGKVASAENSLYKQGRLYRGSPERADELIQSQLSPILKVVEKSGKTTEDLGDYALAVHAKDVNAKGINSGLSDERIAATIAKHRTLEMEIARKELIKISNDSLDALAEAGIIEQDLVAVLREKHPNYMPLFRSFDDAKIEFSSGLSKAMANVTSPIKKLVGSDRDVVDPIESMIKNIYKTVSAVDRNKVASQLGRLADEDVNSTFIRRLAEGEEKSRLNTVYAMEGGKKVSYEVQPDVYKALMNLDRESSNILIKVLQKPAGLLRSGATLTPEFSLRNPMRDVVQAYVVSKSGFNPITDTTMGLINVIGSKFGKQTMFNQFLKDNAGFGNIISMDRKAHQDVISDILRKSPGKKFVNIISGKSLINVLRTITDVTESATKLGEYRAALRSGASRPEAAYRARDLMDFARSGSSVRETNKIVAFLNANIQGKSKLYRAIKENPVGVTTRAITSITIPTVGVYMAQKYLANEEQKTIISDAPDWMTSTFWLVPIPGTSQVARIPKPFDLAPIFANIPERALKYIEDNDPEAFDGYAKQTLASAAIPTMITGLIPFIEGMANYSFFREGPIIPQRESDLNYPDQYDIRTTETGKFLAKGMNKLTGGQGPLKNFGSPRIMDNTIRGATAGLGGYATSAIDLIAETTGIVDAKNKPARNISELPLLRAFLTSEKSGGKSMDKLYNEKDKLTRDKGSLKINSPGQSFPQGDRLSRLNTVTGKIGDITKEIRKIEGDKEINPQTKRDQINSLITKRNGLAMETMGN